MESMGVASGCGCKELYRFPHITYPYVLLLYIHAQNVFPSCSILTV